MTGHITESVDTLNGGVLVLVNHDVAAGIQLNTRDIQLQVFDLGGTANSPEKLVDLELRAIMANELEQAILALAIADELYLLETAVVAVKIDASGLIAISHSLLDHRVELAQEVLAADEHVSLNINGVEDTSNLNGDVASTDNGDLRGKLFQLEESITSDTVLGAGHGGEAGPATGRQQDVGCGVAGGAGAISQIDLEGVRLDEASTTLDEVDSFTTPVALVCAVQSLDDGITGVLEVGVVHSNVIGDVVTIALSNVQHLVDGRKVPCHLLGDTSKCCQKKASIKYASITLYSPYVDTGTSRPPAFHD